MVCRVSIIDQTLNKMFGKLGVFIGHHPGYFIIVPVLLTLLCMTGWVIWFPIEWFLIAVFTLCDQFPLLMCVLCYENSEIGINRSNTRSIPNICFPRSTDWAKMRELSSSSTSRSITRIVLTLAESPDQVTNNHPASPNYIAWFCLLFLQFRIDNMVNCLAISECLCYRSSEIIRFMESNEIAV